MTDPDLLSEVMAAYDIPEELRDWITASPPPDSLRLREERYRKALPGRMAEIAAELSEGPPDGMRLEWR